MTYDEAISHARRGLPVIRPHWCWVALACGPRGGLVIRYEDVIVAPYRPNRSDREATDWMRQEPPATGYTQYTGFRP